jgi:hypothetical protein
MLANLIRPMLQGQFIFIYIFLFIIGCTSNAPKQEESPAEFNISIKRFDSDIATHGSDIGFLEKKYGNFFYRYCNNIIPRMRSDNSAAEEAFQKFIADPDFNEVNQNISATFKDMQGEEKKLREAFRQYSFDFIGRKIPEVVTFNSLFNFAIITTDTVLGIGLDMYLGSSSAYYPALGFPEYKIRKMRREYIPVDAMRGWIESEYPVDESKYDFLSQMIYKGKIVYVLDALMPELNDTLKTGYSAAQLEWCYENEKSIWSFFVDQKLLFSNSIEQYSKYISEGPTTNGFPKESPGNIAAFIGWQIVKSYMIERPGMTLEQLMNQNDAAIILKDSKYKPKK